jgi:predicted DNA-binding antitoxin AbrB/MazE fold protein
MRQGPAMTIAAKYEDGVFKPLENVEIPEGTVVEVRLPPSPPRS